MTSEVVAQTEDAIESKNYNEQELLAVASLAAVLKNIN